MAQSGKVSFIRILTNTELGLMAVKSVLLSISQHMVALTVLFCLKCCGYLGLWLWSNYRVLPSHFCSLVFSEKT